MDIELYNFSGWIVKKTMLKNTRYINIKTDVQSYR